MEINIEDYNIYIKPGVTDLRKRADIDASLRMNRNSCIKMYNL